MADIYNFGIFDPPAYGSPVRVSMIWLRPDSERNDEPMQINAVVNDGDFKGVIESVREKGGVYLDREDKLVFLPWPPDRVDIEPL